MIAGQNFRTVTEQCWSSARRVGDIAKEGVDVQVLSPMPELLSYWFTPQDAVEMCQYTNESIAKLVQSSPQHFYGLGMVPLQEPDLAAKELAEVKKMGLVGVELGSNILGKSLGEPRFLPFFQEVERQGMCVFVHALHPTMADRIVGPEQLLNAVGFPTDTGLTIAALITGRVLEQCPTLRLAFSHGGGTFPFFLPRLEHAWSGQWNGERSQGTRQGPRNALWELLPKSPAEYARTLYYDTLLFDRRAIRYLMEMMGYTQLVVGTDFPFVPREQPVGRTLRSMGLSDQELEAVTWENCLRFLGVKAPVRQAAG
jgi:aminocarboxymuconate-semialdehyde decarboxylase